MYHVELEAIALGIHPQWSPDGNVMLFEQYVPIDPTKPHGTRRSDLFRINVDGTELVNLTQNSEAADWRAEWSPDGTRIVFSQRWGDHLNQSTVAVMQADGSGMYALTEIVPFERWDETGGGFISTTPYALS